MMAPIVLNAGLLGVVEVALLTSPDTHQREQFEEMVQILAMNLEIVGRSTHAAAMLSATAERIPQVLEARYPHQEPT